MSDAVVERVAVKALRAAVCADGPAVTRALSVCRGWSNDDRFRLCLVVAGRAADVLSEQHQVPLGGGRWSDSPSTAPDRVPGVQVFAARFLTAAANLDDDGCRGLWAEQLQFAQRVVSVPGGSTVVRMAVAAMVGHAAYVHRVFGIVP